MEQQLRCVGYYLSLKDPVTAEHITYLDVPDEKPLKMLGVPVRNIVRRKARTDDDLAVDACVIGKVRALPLVPRLAIFLPITGDGAHMNRLNEDLPCCDPAAVPSLYRNAGFALHTTAVLIMSDQRSRVRMIYAPYAMEYDCQRIAVGHLEFLSASDVSCELDEMEYLDLPRCVVFRGFGFSHMGRSNPMALTDEHIPAARHISVESDGVYEVSHRKATSAIISGASVERLCLPNAHRILLGHCPNLQRNSVEIPSSCKVEQLRPECEYLINSKQL